ncbi:MAG: FkbM family methyltransferase [Candidatus Woesearchaeota archaeon]
MKLSQKIFYGLKIFKVLKNPWTYAYDYFKLKKKDLIFKLRKYNLKLIIRPQTYDRAVFGEVFLFEEYPLKVSKKEMIIIDVGAHIGFFTLYAKRLFPNSTIYSFEPDKQNFSYLNKNLNLNKIKGVKSFNLAVSNSDNKIDFYLSEHNVGHSTHKTKDSKKISIDSISFTSIIKENKINWVDILKVDIEGGEYDLFYNLNKNVLKKVNLILLEWHNLDKDKNNWKELKKYLISKGFKVRKYKNYLYCKNVSK